MDCSGPWASGSLPELAELRRRLSEIAAGRELALAYSGGLDSRFLAFVCRHLGLPARLLHVSAPHIAPADTVRALADARAMGLEPVVVRLPDFDLAALAAAGRQRCYVCKGILLRALRGRAGDAPLIDGSNASDRDEFRPGRAALRELGVRSPLAEAGCRKERVRELARALGLPRPEQAARPCLLTRFPYGTRPGPEELSLLARAEDWLESRPEASGLRFRLRFPCPDGPLLHIESASAAGRSEADLAGLAAALRAAFQPRLDRARLELVERLSGFYDREAGSEGQL